MSVNNCNLYGTKEQEEFLVELLTHAKKKKYTIIRVLQDIQKIYGYLPESVLNKVSFEMGVPVSEICSVASFYAEFSFSPKGEYPISVCMGTACYVNGAEDIFNKVCHVLRIKEGETSEDGKFSIDQTRCVGCCGMAPVMSIGDDVYGNVKIGDVEKILTKYMEKK